MLEVCSSSYAPPLCLLTKLGEALILYKRKSDDASRLVSASYSVANNSDRYSTRYSYDCMGNITSLRRNGLLDDGSYGLIDNLKLTYDGNLLKAVSDDGDDPTYNNAWNFMDGADNAKEYEYDANGNVTKDLNRNILSIQYNSLNLPSMIKFADGKTIKYTYSADGRKLRAVYTTVTPATSKQVDYCGNLIFENGQLKQMLVDGGYIPMDDWSGAYRFYVKDHLGNNRMVMHEYYGAEQMNNYYPYGGLMSNSTGWNAQRFKYNGKEFDRMHGLDWYDYGARWMDASIGRWHSMDPLCEKYYNISPYAYANNNPVRFIDPDGMASTDFYDENGQHIGTDNIANNQRVVVTNSADVANVQNQMANNGTVDANQISSGVTLPADNIMNEAINVMDRTIQNGGTQEERTVMFKDGTKESKTGNKAEIVHIENSPKLSAKVPMELNAYQMNNRIADIHSHVPCVLIDKCHYKACYTTAERASEYDLKTFNGCPVNIIVGPIGELDYPNVRENGMVLYNQNGEVQLKLSIGAVKNILGLK